MTPQQTAVLDNIGGEIIQALETARQRRSLLEMRSNQAAMEERLNIFRDLHDNLGQTLAYINLKISQFNHDCGHAEGCAVRSELSGLSKVANDAYNQMRETLTTLRSENTGQLAKMLVERAQMVAERSKLKIEISTRGQPRSLPSKVIRQIVFVFREALTNVEKHSGAQSVKVQLNWSENELILRITDNGHGFEPRNIQKGSHFGLSIMQERIEAIGGQFILNPRPGKGTEILLYVPGSDTETETT